MTMIKLYDLLMSLEYDWYSNPMELDQIEDGEKLTLPVKINGGYEYLPADKEMRETFIEEELINCEVTSITVQINTKEEGRIEPVVKIFTDGLHEKPFD